ncbi:MAG: DUF1576 domain-containing protein [Clostridia bacterium]|nr:DUF1576 domain-containing protein [Clostridia bacterium]
MKITRDDRLDTRSPWERRNDRLLFDYMCFWSAAFFLGAAIAAVAVGEWRTLPADFLRLLISPSKLITDYFEIGSLSATLLNAGLCGVACNLILILSHTDPDGRVLAGYFLVVAHCFYGLNFVNMWPTFFGVLIFSLVTRRPFRKEVHIALFSTSLGPFISDFLFRYTIGDAFVFGEVHLTVAGVVLALLFGIFTGFLVPALLSGTAKMYRGFNLFKAGLAVGLLGTFVYAFMYKTLGVEPPDVLTRENPIYESYGRSFTVFITVFFGVIFVISVLWGFLLNGKTFRGYRNVFFSTGHDVDFSERYGSPLAFINFGVLGIAILLYLHVSMLLTEGVGFTGPTTGVIIAALTFAAAGQTVRNVWPIVLGHSLLWSVAYLSTLLLGIPLHWSLTTQAYISGLAFATGLCPFAGKYGWKIGTLAGFVDAIICSSTVMFHGGFVLYNGGFAAGLTALLLVPILDFYGVKEKHVEPASLAPEENPKTKETEINV